MATSTIQVNTRHGQSWSPLLLLLVAGLLLAPAPATAFVNWPDSGNASYHFGWTADTSQHIAITDIIGGINATNDVLPGNISGVSTTMFTFGAWRWSCFGAVASAQIRYRDLHHAAQRISRRTH